MTERDPLLSSPQAGATLVEAILSLALMSVVAVGIGQAISSNSLDIRTANAASQMAELRAAADRYVQDNFASLVTSAAGGPISIPVSTLTAGNYLPPSFPTTNPYNQTYQIYLRERSSTVLESIVLTTGGTALSAREGGAIALLLKASGGFVPQGSATANGTKGAWTATLSAFVPGGQPTPSGNPVDYSIHYPVYGPTGALIRFATGTASDNQMATTLDMNGNAINNAGNINANSLYAIETNNDASVTAMTPNAGSTGGIRLLGNPASGRAYFQVTNYPITNQWGVATITPDGTWSWSGTINAAAFTTPSGTLGVPSGAIAAFAGACPSGWSTYSAANDRVIVGAGASYSSGQTGGSDSVTLSVNQIPSHQHGTFLNAQIANGGGTSVGPGRVYPDFIGSVGNGYFDYNITGETTDSSGWRTLSQAIGGGQPFDNRQQFLALNHCVKN